MRVKVEVAGSGVFEVEVDEGATVADLFERLGLNPESYVALVDGGLVVEEEPLRDGATVVLVKAHFVG